MVKTPKEDNRIDGFALYEAALVERVAMRALQSDQKGQDGMKIAKAGWRDMESDLKGYWQRKADLNLIKVERQRAVWETSDHTGRPVAPEFVLYYMDVRQAITSEFRKGNPNEWIAVALQRWKKLPASRVEEYQHEARAHPEYFVVPTGPTKEVYMQLCRSGVLDILNNQRIVSGQKRRLQLREENRTQERQAEALSRKASKTIMRVRTQDRPVKADKPKRNKGPWHPPAKTPIVPPLTMRLRQRMQQALEDVQDNGQIEDVPHPYHVSSSQEPDINDGQEVSSEDEESSDDHEDDEDTVENVNGDVQDVDVGDVPDADVNNPDDHSSDTENADEDMDGENHGSGLDNRVNDASDTDNTEYPGENVELHLEDLHF